MTGEDLQHDESMSLFEAARWAPSSFNNQPWRFIYAKRNTEYWERLLGLLADSNKIWAKDAAVLIVVVSSQNFEYNGKPSITHQFDAGAAWENLSLEAASRGLVAHGMQGFDYEKARKELEVPDSYDVMAMIAIGKRGSKEKLPSKLQEKEIPNDRKPLNEIIMEGKFRK
jgi:nitroreductase